MDIQAKIEDAMHELDKAIFAGAVAAERERCARVAEGQAEFVAGETHERLCHDIAAAIRNRAAGK